MKNATHTPGPWKLSAGRTIETPHGDFFLSYNSDRHGNPTFRPINGWSELDANAKLCSAAPELLAALQSSEQRIRELSPKGYSAPELWEIRAAIAKATGEEVA